MKLPKMITLPGVDQKGFSLFKPQYSVLIAMLVLLMLCGCVMSLKDHPSESPDVKTSQGKDGDGRDSVSKLIKATIPEEAKQDKPDKVPESRNSGKKDKIENPEKTEISQPPKKEISAASKEVPKETIKKKDPKPVKVPESVKVKNAALEMGKNMSSVEKIKICHDGSADEWWVIFYDDIGAMIDLKQYVWEVESESLTPFLVLKRIPRSRLETHLNMSEPERKCEVIDNQPKKKVEDKEGAKDSDQGTPIN